MTTESPDSITVTHNHTYGELFIASMILIRYRARLIILHSVFPIAGLFLLVYPSWIGRRVGVTDVLIALLTFSFTPLITALGVWLGRRRNKLAEGPFTYTFTSEGIQTSGAAFTQTIRWAGVFQVRRSQRFLFIFLSPARAICIPIKVLGGTQALERLRNIAGKDVDFRC